jgi:hypothetical protein
MEYEAPIELYKRVSNTLSAPVDDTIHTLRFEVLEKRVAVQEELYRRRYQYMLPKDKGVTELDRQIHLDNTTAHIQKDYEFLIALEKLLADKVAYMEGC